MQLAWLNATPSGRKVSRLRQIQIDAESEGEEPEYDLPDVAGIEILVSILSEIGEANARGGHLSQVEWADIEAWAKVTGESITPWEAVTVRYLSGVYVNQYYASSDPGCVAPVLPQPKSREIIASQFESLFSMMRK